MAGTWMSIVEGFGGLKIIDDMPSFTTKLPEQWTSFSFKINFRDQILKVHVTRDHTTVTMEGESSQDIIVNGIKQTLEPVTVNS
jgi:maltose phosphorylase